MSRPDIISCWVLEKWGLWDTKGCCISCHEDQDTYGYDACSVGDRRLTPVLYEHSAVCCAVANELGQVDGGTVVPGVVR